MEETNQRQNKLQVVYQQVRTSFFNIMFELLKEKNTGVFFGCIMMLITFLQLIGLIFEPEQYGWKDQFFLNFVVNLCSYSRAIEAINNSQSVFFYWALMLFGVIYLITMIGLLIFMNHFLQNRKLYMEQVVQTLRIMIILMFWVFYLPFFESFISIFRCNEDGMHYMDGSLKCFEGLHIFFFVVCLLFLVILFVINIIVAMLFNETQPVQEDCLARMESSFEVALVIYRSLVGAFAGFCHNETCSWILITVYIIAGALLCYQYYKQVPYYNSFVSIFCGSIIFTYFWISLNALLMKFLNVNGHIVIIIVGIPMITLLVKSLRENRIECLMKTNIDKLSSDIDALIQVHKMTDFSRGTHRDQSERMTMIGVINLHIAECQNTDCPCKETYELFDIKMNDFQVRNYGQMHQNEVFLSHFIKKLYDDALNKFVNSPGIHIGFSYYLFKVMNNIHASLLELNIAQKKKPSLQQQFTIFRYKNIIEDFIVQDHLDHREVYPQLTNVIEFERLFSEMQKTIEQVANLQVEFWTHLTTLVPDLNVLNELGKKVYIAAETVDRLWGQLCLINPHYQHALTLYGEYLKEIRNHEHLGTALIEKGFNNMAAKKALDEHAASSDILFSDDTTVLHVSGNKESIGKILNTSQGLSKVFGYSKNEVVGHSINILMPAIFAKFHTEFMERFFKTGRQVIFYQERQLFATHRNGYCFHMKILVKQFPNLVEGIQYVGMMKPIMADFEYVITDMEGVIDSFTKGVTGLININPSIFKDKDSQINIQLIAPDLIQFFLDTQSRGGKVAKSKYREAGGEPLTLIVPENFNQIAKTDIKSTGARSAAKNRGHKNAQQNAHGRRSNVFKKFLRALQRSSKRPNSQSNNQRDMPSVQDIMNCPEYKNCEKKKDVQCEIMFLEFKMNSVESQKMLVFKLSKNVVEKDHKGIGGDEFGVPGLISRMTSKRFDNRSNPRSSRRRGEETGDGSLLDGEEQLIDDDMQGAESEYRQEGTGGSRKVGFHNLGQQPDDEDREEQQDLKSEHYNQESGDQQKLINKKASRGTVQSDKFKTPYMNNGSQVSGAKSRQSQRDTPGIIADQTPGGPINNTAGSQLPSGSVEQKSSKQEFNANSQQDQSDHDGSQNDDPNDSPKSPKFKQQSIKQSQRGVQNNTSPDVPQPIQEEDLEETPRLDVSNLKLEQAQQKEKVSFFEQLRNQSFIMSDNSTNKIDGKLNITDQQRQEKISFEKQHKELFGSREGGESAFGQQQKRSQQVPLSPDKMVKVPQPKNFKVGNLFAGDDEEPQDFMREDTTEQQQQQQQQTDGTNKKSATQKDEDDEEEESHPLRTDDEEQEDEQEESEQEDDDGIQSIHQSERQQSERNRAGGSNKESTTKGSALVSSSAKVHIPSSTNNSKKMEDNQRGSQKAGTPGSMRANNLFQQQQQDSDIPNFNGVDQQNSINRRSKFGEQSDRRKSQQQYDQHTSHSHRSRGNDDQEEEKKPLINKRDTNKIKTNPKYKCHDEGSDEDADDGKAEDYGQLSSKEIDFRETIIKQEKKRLKRERKLKEKEMKKLRALNGGEDGQDGETGAGSTRSGRSAGGSDDDEDGKSDSESSSSDSSSDDSKGATPGAHAGSSGQKKMSRKSSLRENDDGDVSSVSTRRSKTERNHYILRAAIDEKYVPRSINNLRYAAYLIFLILTLLSIVYYVIRISLFDKINQNIKNIHNSEERLSYIIDITLRTRTLTLVNADLLTSPNATAQQRLINVTIDNLRESARNLKDAQTDLSLKTAFLSAEQLHQINPEGVALRYKKYPNMPDQYLLSMWEAIMEIIVSAFRISTLTLSEIMDDQVSVFFVMQNCLNSVLQALKSSTDAIIDESESSRETNMAIFLYLLIAASCSLLLSLLFLIPVINKVKKNKQEVLELFTHKNIDKHIDDQLKVCRNFVSLRLQQNNEVGGGIAGGDHEIDENGNAAGGGAGQGQTAGDRELQNDLNGNSKFMRRNKKKSKGKKWKKLNSNFGATLLKFLLFITVIEGYFLANYLLSDQFLSEVQQLTQELKLLISRQPVQAFLLLIQKELIYSNGTALIEGQKSETYVPVYHESVYDEEEALLDKFSANYDYHSAEYNELFNNIVYSNVCQYVSYDSRAVCEDFNQGILKKGIYSSVIKYWDFLRQLNHDFMESPRKNTTIKQFLNDQRLNQAETMQDYYFKRAIAKLVAKLEVDIDSFFEAQYVQNRTIFIIYIFYILLLYFLIWRKFVGEMQNELWKTKSMLGILPIKVCFDIEEIRQFIYTNSSNDFLATKL